MAVKVSSDNGAGVQSIRAWIRRVLVNWIFHLSFAVATQAEAVKETSTHLVAARLLEISGLLSKEESLGLTEALESELKTMFEQGSENGTALWAALLLAKGKCDVRLVKEEEARAEGCQQAIAWLEKAKAIASDPGLTDLIDLRLVRLLFSQGQRDQARALLEQLRTPLGKAQAQHQLGDCYFEEHDLISAKAAYQASLKALEEMKERLDALDGFGDDMPLRQIPNLQHEITHLKNKLKLIAHVVDYQSEQA